MDQLTLMEQFADPNLFANLSFADKIAGSLVTTVMGIGATFVILIIIWLVISIISRIINPTQGKAKKPQTDIAVAEAVKVQPSSTVADTKTEELQGTELIAVIMAAIAAKEGSEYTSNLIVRKINRISGSRPTWNLAGSADCVESRKIF